MKRIVPILAGLLLYSSAANAAVMFTGTNGSNLTASITFTATNGLLTVLLTNSSLVDVLVPSNVLTAVFFNLGTTSGITAKDAVLNIGSSVIYGDATPTNAGGSVGSEWAYASAAGGLAGGTRGTSGISSAGFGVFGAGNFCGAGTLDLACADLDNPQAVNGLNYGITSAGDNIATGNSGVTGNPLIKNAVKFTMTTKDGAGNNITLTENQISNVTFQYGTALDEPCVAGTGGSGTGNCTPPPPVPEPSTAMLLLLGSGGLATFGYRRRRWSRGGAIA